MVLAFKEQFKDQIKYGRKIHTIRQDSKNRWKAGNKIHFATGVRTKNYNEFFQSTCKSVQSIKIKHDDFGNHFVYVGGTGLLNIGQVRDLAYNDGFSSVKKFFEWFDKDFEGKIIHWTDFKY